MLRIIGPLFAVLTLAACGTTSVALTYAPTTTVQRAPAAAPAVNVARFSDERGEPSTYLGSIRGGFGQPVKTLESERPVAEVVTAAFADGMRERGFRLGPDAPLRLSGSIKRLDCNQMLRPEATAEVQLVVTKVETGRPVFTKTYNTYNVEGATLAAGVFGSVDGLRVITERTLRELVDKALEDPPLRDALRP